jgi:hypothetical protein
MTYGINTTNFAAPLLNTVHGTSFVLPGTWIQLHTGDPGAAGTANLSLVTTRQQAIFATTATGTIALSASPTPWNMTGTETIVAISVWSTATGGVPYWTAPLTSSQPVVNGDTVTLNTCSLSIGPLAV